MSCCECGCGREAGVYAKTGLPKRFLHGHNPNGSHADRVRAGQRSGDARRAKRDAAVPDERVCEGCGKIFDPRGSSRTTHRRTLARRYCSRECAFEHRIEKIVRRVMRRVERRGECWVWTGTIQTNGYGTVSRGRRGDGMARVHRVMYEAAHGPIPDGHVVHHTCLERACCNPAHLQAFASQAEHMAAAHGRGESDFLD